jgi:hypothetical protein
MSWGFGWLAQRPSRKEQVAEAVAAVTQSKLDAQRIGAEGAENKKREANSLMAALRELGREVDRGIDILEDGCLRDSGRRM